MQIFGMIGKSWNTLKWLPAFLAKIAAGRNHGTGPFHLIFCLADHFEPAIVPGLGELRASRAEQERRVEQWCRLYPALVERDRDADGFPFRHTYFYPAEQYDHSIVQRMAEHCHQGWGELEIQLHHGIEGPDTPEHTRQTLVDFRDMLVGHGCLSRVDGSDRIRYGFVHGNWALANSNNGRACGVDNEMEILEETGCYADFTLPSAPNPAQVRKINALYECTLPFSQRVPHRSGRDLRRGRPVTRFPLIVQGPLWLHWKRPGKQGFAPCIENSALTTANPATLARLEFWLRANIHVVDRSDWVFIKLHCHGMDPRDEEGLLGSPMLRFLHELREQAHAGAFHIHYTTAREMVNILLAACDGKEGAPGHYRDYHFRLVRDDRRISAYREPLPNDGEVSRAKF